MVPHFHAPPVFGYGDVGMDALSFSIVSSCVHCRIAAVAALVVDGGSGYVHSCFFLVVFRVLSFGRQAQDATPGPLCTRRTVISGLCMAGFAGYVTFALCSLFIVGTPCGASPGQVALVRRCATTGAGRWPDSAENCVDSTGAVLGRGYGSLRHVSWSRQCKPSGGAAVAAHLQGRRHLFLWR